MKLLILFLVVLTMGSALKCPSAEIPKTPVPSSPYLPLVYRFADTMLERAPTNETLFSFTNVQNEQNFLRVLYTLSELSGKPKYRLAADAVLKSFVTELSTVTATQQVSFLRPWMLWDKCFEVAPEASKKFALSLIKQKEVPARERGFYLRTWGQAYARTKDEQWLRAIAKSVDGFESEAPAGSISLAIDADGAGRLVPEPLAGRLLMLAEREDRAVLESQDKRVFPLWSTGTNTTRAQAGSTYLSRYHNTAKVAYRKLLHDAADNYLAKFPDADKDLSPRALGQAISLQTAAWKHTARPEHLQHARKLADLALEKFWGTNAIPRGSLNVDDYQSHTGIDTLALAFVELHLNILHITAVRCPPNTIDR